MSEENEYRINTANLNDNDKIDIVLFRLENRNKTVLKFLKEKKSDYNKDKTKRRWSFLGIPHTFSIKYTGTEAHFFLSNVTTKEKEDKLSIGIKNEDRSIYSETTIGELNKNPNYIFFKESNKSADRITAKTILDEIEQYKKDLLDLASLEKLTEEENNKIAESRKNAFDNFYNKLIQQKKISNQSVALSRTHYLPSTDMYYPHSIKPTNKVIESIEYTSGGKKSRKSRKSKKSSPKRKRRTYKK
jgi:hypothetical protein